MDTDGLELLAARVGLVRVKRASVATAVGARPGRLASAANWLSGGFSSLDDMARPAFGALDAHAEELRELQATARRHVLTGGLASRPGFHVQDRLVGGVPGAVAGYNADEAAGGQTDTWGGTARRIGATAAGGWLGGKALNESVNVGRRYVANTAPLFGYDAASVPRLSPRSIWSHGVRDRPMVGLHNAGGAGNPRYELLRRYLGVHKPGPSDLFVQNADRSLSFNPETVRPGTDTWSKYIQPGLNDPSLAGRLHAGDVPSTGLIRHGPARTAPNRVVDPGSLTTPPAYATDQTKNPFNLMFGSHDMRHVPGTAQATSGGGATTVHEVGDVWNMRLDPHETPEARAYIRGLARTSPGLWGRYLRQPASRGHPDAYGGAAASVGDRLKNYGMRTAVERVLRQQSPVIRQRMRFNYHAPTAFSGPASGGVAPASAEFLPTEAAALGPDPALRRLRDIGLATAGGGGLGYAARHAGLGRPPQAAPGPTEAPAPGPAPPAPPTPRQELMRLVSDRARSGVRALWGRLAQRYGGATQ